MTSTLTWDFNDLCYWDSSPCQLRGSDGFLLILVHRLTQLVFVFMHFQIDGFHIVILLRSLPLALLSLPASLCLPLPWLQVHGSLAFFLLKVGKIIGQAFIHCIE